MQQHNLFYHFEQLIELPASSHLAYISQHISCDNQATELKGLLSHYYQEQTKTEWHDLIANQVQEVTGDHNIDDDMTRMQRDSDGTDPSDIITNAIGVNTTVASASQSGVSA